jgi:hypothetical protein
MDEEPHLQSSNILEQQSIVDGPVKLEQRRSFIEDGFLGDRIPERLAKGPVKVRRATDVNSCIALLVCFLLFFCAAAYFWYLETYSLLALPMDSDSTICGKDEEVKDYPFLYIVKFERPFRSVCVKECPKFDYNQIRYNADGRNYSYRLEPMYFEQYYPLVKDRINYQNVYRRKSEGNEFYFDENLAQDYYTQKQFEDYTNRFKLDCVPNKDVTSCEQMPMTNFKQGNFKANENNTKGLHLYDARSYSLKICVPLSPNILIDVGLLTEISSALNSDLKRVSWIIAAAMLVSLLMGLALVILSSMCLRFLLWCNVFLCSSLCCVIGVVCWIFALFDLSDYLEQNNYKFFIVSQARYIYEMRWKAMLTGTLLFLTGIGFFLVALYNKASISKASAVLRYSMRIIALNMELVLLGVIMFCFEVAIFAIGMWNMLGIYTSGDLVRGKKSGDPIPHFKITFYRWVYITANGIMTYWLLCFLNNLVDFIASATTVNNYFNIKRRFFVAVRDTLTYHLGSVSFASLILFPATFIQTTVGWMFDIATSDGMEGEPNQAQRFFDKVFTCIKYPYRKFFMRVTESALGMVYLSCSDFCPSTKETFYLLLSYEDKVGKLDLVANMYKFTQVITISIINSLIFYSIFLTYGTYTKNLHNPLALCMIIFCVSAIVSTIFMTIYATVCQSSVLCYLIQYDNGVQDPKAELQVLVEEAEKVEIYPELSRNYTRLIELKQKSDTKALSKVVSHE